MMQIWQRYLLKELAKIFILFMGCFYFLYVLIDYSVHSKAFQQNGIGLFEIALYYFYQFTKRADVLIPIALLISVIKVLTTLTLRNEIGAMVVGGLSLKRLVQPFLLAASLLTFLLYINFHFLQPRFLSRLHDFEKSFFKDASKEMKTTKVHSLLLKDNSLFVYQSFDSQDNIFFDSYWFKKEDQFYRIKTLQVSNPIAVGKYVDTLERSPSGEIVRQRRDIEVSFPEMLFDKKTLFQAAHPPKWQSLTQLFRNMNWTRATFGIGKLSDREAEVAVSLFYKLTIPLTCLLIVIGSAPFSVRFGRGFSVFKIYALALFSIITFFTILNSCMILGESQVIPPFAAIFGPQVLAFLGFGWKYAKL
ncbi:MAG: LptF/LptG family permease [Chlamydiales bacterium]